MPITFIEYIHHVPCGFLYFQVFTKDSIVAGAISYYQSFQGLTIIPLFIIVSAAFNLLFYMFRLIFLVFLVKIDKNQSIHILRNVLTI